MGRKNIVKDKNKIDERGGEEIKRKRDWKNLVTKT